MAQEISGGLKGVLLLRTDERKISKIATFNGRGSLFSWLRILIYREVLAYNRKLRIDDIENVTLIDQEEYLPDEDLKAFEKIMSLGFAQLAKNEKYILKNYFVLRKPEREIAELLDVHVSTVSRRIQRVCNQLQMTFVNVAKAEFGIEKSKVLEFMERFQTEWNENVKKILQ